VNFYWRFIQDFSAKAQPLFDLTRSEQVWTWSGKEQAAFEDLKTAVTTAPVLVSPQESDPFRIEVDSSDFTVTLLENFRRKFNIGYTLYPWISLLESTLETSYKPQT